MGDVIDFKKKQEAFTVRFDDCVSVIGVDDIRDLASKKIKAEEYGDVNSLCRTLAQIILDKMENE